MSFDLEMLSRKFRELEAFKNKWEPFLDRLLSIHGEHTDAPSQATVRARNEQRELDAAERSAGEGAEKPDAAAEAKARTGADTSSNKPMETTDRAATDKPARR